MYLLRGLYFICFQIESKALQVYPAENRLTKNYFNVTQHEHFKKKRVFWHIWDESPNELFN